MLKFNFYTKKFKTKQNKEIPIPSFCQKNDNYKIHKGNGGNIDNFCDSKFWNGNC